MKNYVLWWQSYNEPKTGENKIAISTKKDDRHHWLRGGQNLLERRICAVFFKLSSCSNREWEGIENKGTGERPTLPVSDPTEAPAVPNTATSLAAV
mmetsp:Transcript_36365/g.94587  ORF Transcript_36365/g.94587 Transcript_36365/m.94587 type:complete len:96 (-) Transcript_36365:1201-1488(-)